MAKTMFYMEKGRGHGNKSVFWKIQIVGKRTIVRGKNTINQYMIYYNTTLMHISMLCGKEGQTSMTSMIYDMICLCIDPR